MLLLLFWLGGLFGGIRPIKDSFSTGDDVLNLHSRTFLCGAYRLVLAASIPDGGANNGEQNDCANDAACNCTSIRTSITGSTGGHTDGHRALVAGARRGEAGVSDETETPDDVLEAEFAALTSRTRRACRELSWTFYTVAGLEVHYKIDVK